MLHSPNVEWLFADALCMCSQFSFRSQGGATVVIVIAVFFFSCLILARCDVASVRLTICNKHSGTMQNRRTSTDRKTNNKHQWGYVFFVVFFMLILHSALIYVFASHIVSFSCPDTTQPRLDRHQRRIEQKPTQLCFFCLFVHCIFASCNFFCSIPTICRMYTVARSTLITAKRPIGMRCKISDEME